MTSRLSLRTSVALHTLAVFIGAIWLLAFQVAQEQRKEMEKAVFEEQNAIAAFSSADRKLYEAKHKGRNLVQC